MTLIEQDCQQHQKQGTICAGSLLLDACSPASVSPLRFRALSSSAAHAAVIWRQGRSPDHAIWRARETGQTKSGFQWLFCSFVYLAIFGYVLNCAPSLSHCRSPQSISHTIYLPPSVPWSLPPSHPPSLPPSNSLPPSLPLPLSLSPSLSLSSSRCIPQFPTFFFCQNLIPITIIHLNRHANSLFRPHHSLGVCPIFSLVLPPPPHPRPTPASRALHSHLKFPNPSFPT